MYFIADHGPQKHVHQLAGEQLDESVSYQSQDAEALQNVHEVVSSAYIHLFSH